MLFSQTFTTVFTLSFTAVLAHGLGSAIVINECDSPVYLWHVGGSIGQKITLPTNTRYAERFYRDPASGGVALKVTSIDDGLFKPNVSQTIFSYALDGSKVWYDLSDVFGDAFWGKSLEVKPSDASCGTLHWRIGTPPADSQVRVCNAESDLTFTLCPGFCLPAWTPCGDNAPGNYRPCCTGHCIGSHHCVAQ